ncbi:MAG TPA: HDIG domain-containing protein [Bacteroidetes bacterium]|nr:HDIG domain-containing protein [Bacteroidota bacterium]
MTDLIKSKFLGVDKTIQYAMVAAVVFLISLLYPSSVKFKYEFQKGQEWRYEDLYAPFDFAIKKTEAEIRADRERMERDFTPYYQLNTELKGAKIQDCEAAMNHWKAAAAARGDSLNAGEVQNYISFSQRLLEDLYSTGIIELDAAHQEVASPDFVINVVEGNTTYKRTLSSYYQLPEAKRVLRDSVRKAAPQMPPALQQAILDALVPNIHFDKELTEKLKEQLLAGLVTTKGLVKRGDLIVQRGNLITQEVYEELDSFRDKYASDVGSLSSSRVVYLGYLLITILIFIALMMYINANVRSLLLNRKHLAFLLMWILLFSYLTFLIEQGNALNAYLIPFCIVPVVVSHFFNFRLAFFTHVIVVLVAGFLTTLGFPFMFMQIVAGVVAVLAVADARDWTRFFKSVVAIIFAYLLAYFGVSLIEEGNLVDIDWEVYGLLVVNGLLTLMAFPLIPLMEKLFGFTTSISLVELSDMNRPLLRQLAIKAPGTLQHSLQVGNLCEAAAREVGANELLVRVAALYHDIGKMEHPEFFIENQLQGNPHDDINAIESAKIIIAHVTDGVILARKNNLPKRITRFIETHHGTTRVEYFYKTYLQDNPGLTVETSDFTYPGPKPVSKEEGIMMLADSIEAAARSLKEPGEDDIDGLVDKLVDAKVSGGQLDECALTFGDVAKCKAVFKKTLKSVYHVRIEYPE